MVTSPTRTGRDEKLHNATVSVLIPCFNASKFVTSAVESVLAQSWPNVEIIVVNDGSTDDSAEKLQQFESRGVRVFHQKNAGQCAAANYALSKAKGQYIKFFDADDLLHPDMISRQMNQLNGSKEDVASAGWGRFYNDDIMTFKLSPQSVWRDMDARDWLIEAWTGGQPMMQCALWLIPKVILDKTGGWDIELSLINDFEFFARVLSGARNVLFTPNVPLMYRSGIVGSLSGRKSDEALLSAFQSLMRGTACLLEVKSSNQAKRACANMLMGFEYEHYPRCYELRRTILNRVLELGGCDLQPVGSPTFQILRRVFGWKIAKRLQDIHRIIQRKKKSIPAIPPI